MLQDFCSRHLAGSVPEYQLLSSECQVHKPTFVYRVEVGKVVATAPGQSKKKAKHAAALVALQSLLSDVDDVVASKYLSAALEAGDAVDEKADGLPVDAEMNSVGKLQELCMKKRWRPPTYQTFEEVGAPHERMFRMVCEVSCDGSVLRSEGAGRSKKLAKRSAAIRMMVEMECQKHVSSSGQSATHFADARDEGARRADDSRSAKPFEGRQANAFDRLVQFMSGIGDELNRELDPLLDEEDACESLISVSEFLECHAEYEALPSKGDAHNALVHLKPIDEFQTPIPIVTGWGSGASCEEARRTAARRLLSNLKTVRYVR